MVNERNTENLVRSMLKEGGYYDDTTIIVEEQSSANPRIDKLLSTASKQGGAKGYPEFIISFTNKPDDLIVIECKANVSKHESKDRREYSSYAVDGVLLYANYLKDNYNVTAIAVSGETDREKKISTFLWLKSGYTYKSIQDKFLLKPADLQSIINAQSKSLDESELVSNALRYNDLLHSYSIPEVERCTLISALLVALQDTAFINSYKDYSENKHLVKALLDACDRVLKRNHLDDQKREILLKEYNKFENNTHFISDTIYNKDQKKKVNNTILRDLIIDIHDSILPTIKKNEFDVLGKFYTQFIRYASGDKKTGLVLTPSHITNLFCEIANINEDSIVFDPCCGTGGFLVASMKYMLDKAGGNSDKQKEIKSKQLLGVEMRADMFSHACSNMMMRGDGKSHIYYGDCFDKDLKEQIIAEKPTTSFLNPPYQDGNAARQLEFVENSLECLVKSGICVAICQMSTVVSSNNDVIIVKERLLQKHTLKAVFSMPDDLFHPVGVVTCILVFEAHNPHPNNKETFFGYFKNDGLIKMKNKGRVDYYSKWNDIKEKWMNAYVNQKNIAGLSVTKAVTANDEWCAEAYMETDYSVLTQKMFEKTVRDFYAFQYINGKND